jgi:hypothetical protein
MEKETLVMWRNNDKTKKEKKKGKKERKKTKNIVIVPL